MKFDVKLTGARELENMLAQLPAAAAGRIGVSGLRAGANLIRDNARSRVPVKTGNLRKSIKSLVVRQETKTKRAMVVGVTGKARRTAHLVEFGTAAHRIAPEKGSGKRAVSFLGPNGQITRREVRHPGAKAKPFMRPAAATMAKPAINAIAEGMGPAIEREAAKLVRKRAGGGGRAR